MSRTVEIKAPAMDRKTGIQTTVTKSGTVARLYVGQYQRKFLLQHDETGTPESLVDYASGQIVGNLKGVGIAGLLRNGRTMTAREKAERLLKDLTAKHGADKLLAVMKAAPVLND